MTEQPPPAYRFLHDRITMLAAKIDAPAKYLPTYEKTIDGGLPHITIKEAGIYHLQWIDRGQEVDHKTTNDDDELLYWVFAGVTFSMACDYELRHRIPRQDPRRLLFSYQEELLGIMSESWREKENKEHAHILISAPYDDSDF
jgi:immunity protein 63 of polymorphic toxin system